jgi:hypothetical protein
MPIIFVMLNRKFSHTPFEEFYWYITLLKSGGGIRHVAQHSLATKTLKPLYPVYFTLSNRK